MPKEAPGGISSLIGRTIKNIRPMTADEAEREDWTFRRNGAPAVIELDDGTLLYPSRDDEGNGPGALFGYEKGKQFSINFR